jgi:hypothetical protein
MKPIYDEVFDEIMQIIWNRYEQCTKDTVDDTLEPEKYEYLGTLSVAYFHIWEDIRELRRNYSKTRKKKTENSKN